MPDAKTDIETALAILSGSYTAKGHNRPDLSPDNLAYKAKFEEQQRDALNSIIELVHGYVEQPRPDHPLCLAVFGPPGSGKSYGVKQIVKAAHARLKASHAASNEGAPGPEFKLQLPLTTLNLTQISAPADLAAALSRIAGEQTSDIVPVVLFDEFDTSRDGAAYGWLSWFLAPMHDGEVLHSGAVVRLQRAIYVFAGGTASTMSEFSARAKESYFREAKGPDFISRLRGYLDVLGPNDEPRALRRAVILESALAKRAAGQATGEELVPDRELLEDLLHVGRYRHGARSIHAIIETSEVKEQKLGHAQLPPQDFLALHADRGPLDRAAIGGPILLSGFAPRPEDGFAPLMSRMARELWTAGATLAYGGRWDGAFGELLKATSQDLPRALRSGRGTGGKSEPKGDATGFAHLVYFKPLPDGRDNRRVEFLDEPPRASRRDADISALPKDVQEWTLAALHVFCRRMKMAELGVAQLVVAGAMIANTASPSDPGLPQRFPGILEEVMLSLALGKPIYVVGHLGGAAKDVGTLLGLDENWNGAPLPSFDTRPEETARIEQLRPVSARFQPPRFGKLPTTLAELDVFLRAHAIGGARWPKNGLSLQENRALFASHSEEDIVRLMCKGLTKWSHERGA